MKKPPKIQALETAIEWLEVNEGEDGEADDCQSVADWLRHVSAAALKDAAKRAAEKELAAKHGISVAHLKRILTGRNPRPSNW